MTFVQNFPFFTIVLSLLSSVIAFAFRGKKARFVTYALLSVCFAFSVSVILYNLFGDSSYFVYRMGHYDAPIGNEIAAGLLEPVILGLFEFVILCAIIGGSRHIFRDIDEKKQKYFYVMVNLLHAALSALCYTNDIFTAYVFVEICTISSCAILMVREEGRSLVAATRYMIFSLIGSGMFLIGVILLYAITGHLLFPQLYSTVQELSQSSEYAIPLSISVGLMTVGLCIKSGLFPFHFWMPDTYGTATPAASGILSGVVSKGYIFLLLKVIFRVVGWETFLSLRINVLLYVFGLTGMIFGSILAIRSKNINFMVAYSSAAQIGYIYMGIGLGTTAGLIASLFQIFAHALAKPLLFLSIARLEDAAGGSQAITDLRGTAKQDKVAGIGFLAGALSIIGIPLFAGFIPKLSFSIAALEQGPLMFVTLIVLAVSTVLNVVYFLRTVLVIFSSQQSSGEKVTARRFKGAATIAIFVMILTNILVGIGSQPIEDVLRKGIEIFISMR